MSFKIENLQPITSGGKSGYVPNHWTYYNANGDNVTTEGYFLKGAGIVNHDHIIVVSQDYSREDVYYFEEENNLLNALLINE
jgi:glycogen synthase